MVISSYISRIRALVGKVHSKKLMVGFVPTMGALHEGHISLIKQAKRECDFVVVSIFVNPSQFGVGEDFDKYPRPFSRDKLLLKAAGVDLLFAPKAQDMYAQDHSVFIDESALSAGLCGAARPGHFRGVCTVVAKLFNIVTPDIAYFGQKDYQQVSVIKRMVRDLNFPLTVKTCPTVREDDGLARSSRNRYLSSLERVQAVSLSKALCAGRSMVERGERSVAAIVKKMASVIRSYNGVSIDYLELRQADSLAPLNTVNGRVVLLGAVRVGSTRLIDNVLAKGKKGVT